MLFDRREHAVMEWVWLHAFVDWVDSEVVTYNTESLASQSLLVFYHREMVRRLKSLGM